MEGKVICIFKDKGYGFIKVPGNNSNIFFHVNDNDEDIFNQLEINDFVVFETVESKKGLEAINLKIKNRIRY